MKNRSARKGDRYYHKTLFLGDRLNYLSTRWFALGDRLLIFCYGDESAINSETRTVAEGGDRKDRLII